LHHSKGNSTETEVGLPKLVLDKAKVLKAKFPVHILVININPTSISLNLKSILSKHTAFPKICQHGFVKIFNGINFKLIL
jgi:hypothetical protein